MTAVSGGAYIAGAFAFVAKYSDSGTLSGKSGIFQPDSPEATYLRTHCEYVAPSPKDKLTLASRLLLGTALNVGLITIFMFLISRLLAHIYTCSWQLPIVHKDFGPIQRQMGKAKHILGACLKRRTFSNMHIAPWTWPGASILWEGGAIAAIALAVLALLSPVLPDSFNETFGKVLRWLARWFLILGVAGYTALVVIPALIKVFGMAVGQGPGPILALVSFLTGATGAAVVLRQVAGKVVTKWGGKLLDVLALLSGPFFVLTLLLWLTADALNRSTRDGFVGNLLRADHLSYWVLWALLLAAFFLLADANSWSGHSYYRRRLASAFCLRRRMADDGTIVGEEIPYATVTELSKSDPRPWPLTKDEPHGANGPELIVCAAANISDRSLVPPGRRAASFSFSASEMGFPDNRVGVSDLQSWLGRQWRANLTLMGSVTTSGAAFAPVMGKMTKARYRFLLALFNLRLGLWMPNPAREETWKEWGFRAGLARALACRPRAHYLFKEMLGLNSKRDKFLYVTDGGHFDNLGLVELLRRGCTEIYCLDGSGGGPEDFSTLGQAIEIARVDLGVEIDIEIDALRPSKELGGRSKTDHVTGHFTYHDGSRGTLHYARAVLTEKLPLDVVSYAASHASFPHDPTFDQWFDEAQFESYRQLGRKAAEGILT